MVLVPVPPRAWTAPASASLPNCHGSRARMRVTLNGRCHTRMLVAGGDVDEGMPARWGALTERDSQSDGRVWSRDRPQCDPGSGPGAASSPSPSPSGAEPSRAERSRAERGGRAWSGPTVIQQRERPAMVDRARAFKQRVLKRLYCSSPPEEKIKESRAKQEQREEEIKTTNNDAIGAAQIVPEGRKVYTVSLPSGYEVCATRPSEKDESEESSEQPEGRHSTKNFQRKRKRQRKCKSSVHEGLSEKAQTEFQQLRMVQTGSLQAVTLDSAKPEAEILTKNRRRKLKKKRHKEKLRAAGLVSKAAAVELIYQPDENSNDDIAEGGKTVGVMDSNET